MSASLWTDNHEKFLKKYLKVAEKLQEHHQARAAHYKAKYFYTTIGSICCSAFAGSSLFSPFLDSSWAWIINLSSGFIGIVSAILTAIKNFSHWHQIATSHALSAMLYMRIVMKINIELSFPPEERVLPRDFLEEIQLDMFRAQSKHVVPDSDEDDQSTSTAPPLPFDPRTQFQKRSDPTGDTFAKRMYIPDRRGSEPYPARPSVLARRSTSIPDLPLTPTMRWNSDGTLHTTSSSDSIEEDGHDTPSSESEYEYDDPPSFEKDALMDCAELGQKFGICREKYLRRRQTNLSHDSPRVNKIIEKEETRVIVDMINNNKNIT